MVIRKIMSDSGSCRGCNNCAHYPYFHYVKADAGDDIEFGKVSEEFSYVVNHTTGLKHQYVNKKWSVTDKISIQ